MPPHIVRSNTPKVFLAFQNVATTLNAVYPCGARRDAARMARS
jgi:hypothetical protein